MDDVAQLPTLRQREYYNILVSHVIREKNLGQSGKWIEAVCTRAIKKQRPLTHDDYVIMIALLEKSVRPVRTHPAMLRKMWTVARMGRGEEILRSVVKNVTGQESTKYLTIKQAQEIIRRIE